jgi:hypothetical protein
MLQLPLLLAPTIKELLNLSLTTSHDYNDWRSLNGYADTLLKASPLQESATSA